MDHSTGLRKQDVCSEPIVSAATAHQPLEPNLGILPGFIADLHDLDLSISLEAAVSDHLPHGPVEGLQRLP